MILLGGKNIFFPQFIIYTKQKVLLRNKKEKLKESFRKTSIKLIGDK